MGRPDSQDARVALFVRRIINPNGSANSHGPKTDTGVHASCIRNSTVFPGQRWKTRFIEFGQTDDTTRCFHRGPYYREVLVSQLNVSHFALPSECIVGQSNDSRLSAAQ